MVGKKQSKLSKNVNKSIKLGKNKNRIARTIPQA
jgi:hypothetical protein